MDRSLPWCDVLQCVRGGQAGAPLIAVPLSCPPGRLARPVDLRPRLDVVGGWAHAEHKRPPCRAGRSRVHPPPPRLSRDRLGPSHRAWPPDALPLASSDRRVPPTHHLLRDARGLNRAWLTLGKKRSRNRHPVRWKQIQQTHSRRPWTPLRAPPGGCVSQIRQTSGSGRPGGRSRRVCPGKGSATWASPAALEGKLK